jgi:hypothetical protein
LLCVSASTIILRCSGVAERWSLGVMTKPIQPVAPSLQYSDTPLMRNEHAHCFQKSAR